jgi:hypothetical protein
LPAALDTIAEIATALQGDAGFGVAVTQRLDEANVRLNGLLDGSRSLSNVAVTGALSLGGNAVVGGTLAVAGPITIAGSDVATQYYVREALGAGGTISGAVVLGSTLSVTGAVTAESFATTGSTGTSLSLGGNAVVGGALAVQGKLAVGAIADVEAQLSSLNYLPLSGGTVTGAVELRDALSVGGVLTIAGDTFGKASGLSWNAASNQLGVNKLVPTRTVDIAGDCAVSGALELSGASTNTENWAISRTANSALAFSRRQNATGETYTTQALLSSTGTWTTPSDRTLKRDIQPLNIARSLDRVLASTPVSYVMASDDDEPTGRRSVGFIAQDIEAINPHAVHDFVYQEVGGLDGKEPVHKLSVAYADMFMHAIGAIKALHARIAVLEGGALAAEQHEQQQLT